MKAVAEFSSEMAMLCEQVLETEDMNVRKPLMIQLAERGCSDLYDPTDTGLSDVLLELFEDVSRYEELASQAKLRLSRTLVGSYEIQKSIHAATMSHSSAHHHSN